MALQFHDVTVLEVDVKGCIKLSNMLLLLCAMCWINICTSVLPCAESMHVVYLCFAVPHFHDMTALEVELKGRSIPLNVVLHPYAIYLPGSYMICSTVKKLFTVSYLFCVCEIFFMIFLPQLDIKMMTRSALTVGCKEMIEWCWKWVVLSI